MNILFNTTNVFLLAVYLIDCYSEKGAGIALTYFVIFFTPVITFVSHNIIKSARGKKRFEDTWSVLATFYDTQEENAQIYKKKKIFDILPEISLPKFCVFK